MLESLDNIVPHLICPRTGAKLLDVSPGRFETADASETYEYAGECPILVDFEKSVLNRATTMSSGGASPVSRKSKNRVVDLLKRLTKPSPVLTSSNVSLMVADLKRKNLQPTVLIIGGGTVGIGMQRFYDDPDLRVIAFDVYATPFVQFVADGHSIPLAAGSVDGVVIQAVLEHVLEPQLVVSEIHRVLKNDGLVYAETPFMQQVHEGAYDFTRFTDSGHRYLFSRFDALSSGALHGAADQLIRSIEYFARSLFRSVKIGQIVKLGFFWLKYFDLLIPNSYSVDAASSVFFLGRKADEHITGLDAINHYQGAQK